MITKRRYDKVSLYFNSNFNRKINAKATSTEKSPPLTYNVYHTKTDNQNNIEQLILNKYM